MDWNKLKAFYEVAINKSISNGCIEQSPFNAIIIEGALDHVPQKLLNQLENGGTNYLWIISFR